ncbi:MAG TPA: asparaginase, partial [Gemmatimonadales bacterium]|nr:asparaginase [Gemmatimonadales bacterium]
LLATGGTIAMQKSAVAGGNVPALGGRELLAMVGDLGSGHEIRVEDWERLPGVHRGPAEVWALRERVRAIIAGPEAPAGLLITHGTDTLEETAYLLARTLSPDVPIVVTGSMRTSSDPAWDGPRNLRDAVAVAGHRDARNRGTMVVFAGKIFAGLDVTKLDAFADDAFGSPHRRPLGVVDDGAPRFTRPPAANRATLPAKNLGPRVAVIPMILGDDGTLVDAAFATFDGLIIEGFGRGNIPPGAVPAVRRWLDAGKPVVLASRCPFGEAGGEYAFEGGGGQLIRLGVIPSGKLPVPLARLELALSLSAGVPYGGADA